LSWGDVYLPTHIDACGPVIYFCCTLGYDTRVYLFARMCEYTYIYYIAHIRMLIWLSCYCCYYMIILCAMYALYNVLLCKSGNGKPSYACVRFVFTPRLSHPRKSPRVTSQTWHYWVVSRRLIHYCYFSCSSLFLHDIAL